MVTTTVFGAWVIQQKARMAWVANMMTRHEILRHKSGGVFRKKITTTLNAYTKPRWTLITPPQVPLDAADQMLATDRDQRNTSGTPPWHHSPNSDSSLHANPSPYK